MPKEGRAPWHCGDFTTQSCQGAHPYRDAAQRPGTVSPQRERWAPLFLAEVAGQQRLSPLQRGTRVELGTGNPWGRRSGMAGWLSGPLPHRRHGLRDRAPRQLAGPRSPSSQGTGWHFHGRNCAQGKPELWHCWADAAGLGTG